MYTYDLFAHEHPYIAIFNICLDSVHTYTVPVNIFSTIYQILVSNFLKVYLPDVIDITSYQNLEKNDMK